MEERLRERLKELRADFADGRRRLDELEAQARDVQHALLRISGAIQVLEEELSRLDGRAADSTGASVRPFPSLSDAPARDAR